MSCDSSKGRKLSAYSGFGQLPAGPRLTRERELELALRAKLHGDRKAADLLVRAHSRHVFKYALRYRGYGVPMNELIAEGNLGLAHALHKFEPSRGLRFATYATYWVRALMLEHVVKNWSVVRGGTRALDTRWFFRLRRERIRVGSTLGFGAAAETEIAARLQLPVQEVHEMIERLDLRDGSLDAPIGTDSVTLGETLPAPDDQEQSLNELRIQDGIRSAVLKALATLDPRERRIAEWRLLADASEASTLAQIGRDLGVSRVRARQIELRMKRKLCDRIPAIGDAVVNEWLGCQCGVRAMRASSSSSKDDRPSLTAGVSLPAALARESDRSPRAR